VTLLRESESEIHEAGTEFPLSKLGNAQWPETIASGITPAAMELADSASLEVGEEPPQEVLTLLEIRREARILNDWITSDRLRQQIADLGWQVQDLPTEQAIVKRLDMHNLYDRPDKSGKSDRSLEERLPGWKQ
jgi:cysteinyl-tRNA synthetase